MECPAETSNAWMNYKIINVIAAFWVMVQVQYLAETGRRLFLETL
jgi:hypothetical protein